MAGVMPRTALLVVSNAMVIGHCDSYGDTARLLGFHAVKCLGGYRVYNKDGLPMNPSYGSTWRSEDEVLNDWAKCYLKKNITSTTEIYRYLTGE